VPQLNLRSDILRYIVEHQLKEGDRLPTLSDLSSELNVSVSKLREDLEVVRSLGLVQVKPRLGTQVQAFDFAPAATLSVLYAVGLDRASFTQFSRLRSSLELSFWHEAVRQLGPDDIAYLRQLVVRAREKLTPTPIEVPFAEHRALHMGFFKHLQNPFVIGLLEAYWAAYEAFGLSLYAELSYHRQVWDYHEQMVECVAAGNYEMGRRALQEHMTLIRYLPVQGTAPTNDHRPQEEPMPIPYFE